MLMNQMAVGGSLTPGMDAKAAGWGMDDNGAAAPSATALLRLSTGPVVSLNSGGCCAKASGAAAWLGSVAGLDPARLSSEVWLRL